MIVSKTIKIYKTICPVIFLIIFNLITSGQGSNSMYFMENVPQSNFLNPAIQPQCNIFIGMPLIAPLHFEVTNNAFNMEDFIYYDSQLDSVITFLHPSADQDKFLSNFNKRNFFNIDFNTNILNFGFRVKEYYFSLNISQKNSFMFSYPGDIMRLLLKFNLDESEQGQDFNFSDFGLNLFSYNEIGVSVSRKIIDQLTVGLRPKILIGNANLAINNSDIRLNTSREEWEIISNFDVNLCAPGLIIPIDNENKPIFDSIDYSEDIGAKDFLKNKGFAFDIGAIYQPIENLNIYASIVDLGSIKWKNGTYTFQQNGQYTFNGFEYDSFDTLDFGEAVLDSLEDEFSLTATNKAYRTNLPSKFYIGGTYHIIQQISLGILSRTEINQGKLRQQVTVSANLFPTNMFAATISYSIMNNTYNNISLGLGFRTGPFNSYVVYESIPLTYNKLIIEDTTIPVPVDNRNLINLRFGFNLVFGCNRLKKLLKDRPMIQ